VDNRAAPHRFQQVVLADDAIAVPNQIDQEIKDLRFERDQLGAPPELPPVNIKRVIAKDKYHGRSPKAVRIGRFSMNYQAKLNEKSTCSQSLQRRPQVCFGLLSQ
jgi:hypothetical protein